MTDDRNSSPEAATGASETLEQKYLQQYREAESKGELTSFRAQYMKRCLEEGEAFESVFTQDYEYERVVNGQRCREAADECVARGFTVGVDGGFKDGMLGIYFGMAPMAGATGAIGDAADIDEAAGFDDAGDVAEALTIRSHSQSHRLRIIDADDHEHVFNGKTVTRLEACNGHTAGDLVYGLTELAEKLRPMAAARRRAMALAALRNASPCRATRRLTEIDTLCQAGQEPPESDRAADDVLVVTGSGTIGVRVQTQRPSAAITITLSSGDHYSGDHYCGSITDYAKRETTIAEPLGLRLQAYSDRTTEDLLETLVELGEKLRPMLAAHRRAMASSEQRQPGTGNDNNGRNT